MLEQPTFKFLIFIFLAIHLRVLSLLEVAFVVVSYYIIKLLKFRLKDIILRFRLIDVVICPCCLMSPGSEWIPFFFMDIVNW